ncbi:MAG: hypothetical protein LBS29_04730 [Endomicrobium sp.]|jgi:hypothetical protein|nr:hypothetical protein [Endomicrobium sp.]
MILYQKDDSNIIVYDMLDYCDDILNTLKEQKWCLDNHLVQEVLYSNLSKIIKTVDIWYEYRYNRILLDLHADVKKSRACMSDVVFMTSTVTALKQHCLKLGGFRYVANY